MTSIRLMAICLAVPHLLAFAGELPEELAQQFVDEVPGRELTLYPEGLREWHKSPSKVKKYASKAIAPVAIKLTPRAGRMRTEKAPAAAIAAP